jgi:ABC-type lipoprotein export system ATPase subunit
LHEDDRTGQDSASRSVAEQVKDIEGLYEYLFSLEFLDKNYQLKQGDKNLEQLSPGERGALLLVFYLLLDNNDMPLVIDQPEDNLDNHSIATILVPFIRVAKKKRQIIMVTHNPNLAVVSDAEQVIYVDLDKDNNYTFSTTSGSIENKTVNKKIVDVLEGAMPAFNIRKRKYYD